MVLCLLQDTPEILFDDCVVFSHTLDLNLSYYNHSITIRWSFILAETRKVLRMQVSLYINAFNKLVSFIVINSFEGA
jgi:hypothetical protein